jgi:hypothetical protein
MRWRTRGHNVFVRNNAKLWTNTAYAVSTWVVIHQELGKGVDNTLFLIWLGVVSGSELLKRVIAGKLGVIKEEPK